MSSKINDLKNLQKNKNDTSNKISKSDDKKKEDSIKADSVKADSKKEVDKENIKTTDKKDNVSTSSKGEIKKEETKEVKEAKSDVSKKNSTPKLEPKKEETNDKLKKDAKNEEKKDIPPNKEVKKSELVEDKIKKNETIMMEDDKKSNINLKHVNENDNDLSKLNNSTENLNHSNISNRKTENKNDSMLNISKSDDEEKYPQNHSKLDNSSLYIKNKNHSRIEIDADKHIDNTENKKKIFMTENHLKFDNKELFTFHDLIVPAGKNAKLCIVNEPYNKILRITEIADHFKLIEPTPVVLLIGANTKNKGKLFAGISRAAFNTRAIIIDSGLQTGIEKFCIRRNITLIGVAPESAIEYPRPNPEKFSNKMLTNGHSHFILLGNDVNKFPWGDEAKFKFQLADRIVNGRKGFPYKGKGVGIILGNIPNCIEEILICMEKKWPLILIEDSDLCSAITDIRDGSKNIVEGNIKKIAGYTKLIEIDDDSENLASAVHLCLTISF